MIPTDRHRQATSSNAVDSLWVFHAALSCCSLEVEATTGPRFDWERLGCKTVRDHRSADVLFVSGPVTKPVGSELQRIYSEMRGHKFIVAVGSCAATGGMFAVTEGSGLTGLDKYVPVDIFVPGCPPRPESVIHAILRLRDKILRSGA